jgi:hypothetical protein
MKTQHKFLSLSLAGILLITLVALAAQPMRVVAAPPDPTLDWYFIGGSGSSTSNGTLTLDGTLGQSVSGIASSNLCSGFACGLIGWWNQHLPLLLH